jgi:ABC-type glycerol-3-phosphate transport system substrate-binding protein
VTTTYTREQIVKRGVAGAAVVMLSACGGGGSKSSATGSTSVLYEWTYLGTGVAAFWQRAKAQSKGKAKITAITGVPFDTLYQTVQSQNKAKSGADLFAYYPDYVSFKLMDSGDIDPLDQYLGDDPKHWLLASAKFDNKYWGSPLALEIAVMVINRRHFEKAKVDVHDQFESYDALIEACDRLKAAGITPIQMSSADQLGSDKWTMLLTLQVCDNPADLDRGVAGELSLDAPVFSNWMEKLPILRDKYMNPDASKINEQVSNTKFLNGDGGMQIMYTGPIFAPNVGSEYEVIGFPKSSAKFNRPAIGSGDVMVMASYASDKPASGEALKFLHQPAQLKSWWEKTKTLPADDRFDASVLPRTAKATWDFVARRKSDVYSLWWPDNFFPPDFVSYYLGVPAAVMAGASTDQARKKAEEIFSLFRKQNKPELERVKKAIPVIDGVVAQSEKAST